MRTKALLALCALAAGSLFAQQTTDQKPVAKQPAHVQHPMKDHDMSDMKGHGEMKGCCKGKMADGKEGQDKGAMKCPMMSGGKMAESKGDSKEGMSCCKGMMAKGAHETQGAKKMDCCKDKTEAKDKDAMQCDKGEKGEKGDKDDKGSKGDKITGTLGELPTK